MQLLMREYKRLEAIEDNIIADTATTSEMKEFLHLIVKSGNEMEMLNYMRTIGFDSIEEIEDFLSQEYKDKDKDKDKDKGISTGLAIAGGAILLALLFSK